MFEWLLTILSLLGTWYNIQKKVLSWYVWTVANVGWTVSFLMKEMIAEATLFFIYLIFSIYGIIKWSRKPAKESSSVSAENIMNQ